MRLRGVNEERMAEVERSVHSLYSQNAVVHEALNFCDPEHS